MQCSHTVLQSDWGKFGDSISFNVSGFSHWFVATTPTHPLISGSYSGCVSCANCLRLKYCAPLWKHTDLIFQNGAERRTGVHLKQHVETLRWHSVFPIDPSPLRLGTGDGWLHLCIMGLGVKRANVAVDFCSARQPVPVPFLSPPWEAWSPKIDVSFCDTALDWLCLWFSHPRNHYGVSQQGKSFSQ